MKIILSRKGFDSKAGGMASPIFPDNSLLSLPIPSDISTCTYNDLNWKGKSTGSIIRDLSKGCFSSDEFAHVDPDLNSEMLPRDQGWKPIFGQTDGAQSHLETCGVAADDLFLFFGWFRQTKYVNGALTYLPGPRCDIHVIFGWLQVGEIVPINELNVRELPEWALKHPHATRHELELKHPHVVKRVWQKNTIYMAKENLILNGERLPLRGGGVFRRFHPNLQLTWPGYSRRYWKLPRWFYHPEKQRRLSYHRGDEGDKLWQVKGDHVFLKSAAPGQEFVLDTKYYPEAIPWLKDIFSLAVDSD
jgi:hypothetical protein